MSPLSKMSLHQSPGGESPAAVTAGVFSDVVAFENEIRSIFLSVGRAPTPKENFWEWYYENIHYLPVTSLSVCEKEPIDSLIEVGFPLFYQDALGHFRPWSYDDEVKFLSFDYSVFDQKLSDCEIVFPRDESESLVVLKCVAFQGVPFIDGRVFLARDEFSPCHLSFNGGSVLPQVYPPREDVIPSLVGAQAMWDDHREKNEDDSVLQTWPTSVVDAYRYLTGGSGPSSKGDVESFLLNCLWLLSVDTGVPLDFALNQIMSVYRSGRERQIDYVDFLMDVSDGCSDLVSLVQMWRRHGARLVEFVAFPVPHRWSVSILRCRSFQRCVNTMWGLVKREFSLVQPQSSVVQLGLLALGEFVEELGPLSDFIGMLSECTSITQALFILRSTVRGYGLKDLLYEAVESMAVQVTYFLTAFSDVVSGKVAISDYAYDFRLSGDENFVESCVSMYRKLIHGFRGPRPEAGEMSEFLKSFWDYVTHPAFVQTPLFKSFYDVVSNISVSMPLRAMGIMDLTMWEDLVKRHQSYFSCSANDFMAKLVNLAKMVMGNIVDMIKYRDPKLLFGEYNYQSWLAEATKLYQDGASDQEVKKGVFMPYTAAERVERIRGMIMHGEKIQAKLISWKLDNVILTSVAQMLKQLRDKAEGEEVMSKGGALRMTPYTVMILGDPGIGKSTMVQRMSDTLLSKIAFTTGASQIYVHKPGQKHMNGFRTQPVIWFDDVDKTVVQPSGDYQGHAVEFVNIVNCQPYVSPQAELADKGRYFVRPVTVFYTTNHDTCNIRGKITDPLPFWRRVKVRLIVHLRPEFMKDPVSDRTIDPMKVVPGSNPYVYEVQRYCQKLDASSFGEAHMSTVGFIEDEQQLYVFLANDFERHYARERKTLDLMTGEGHCSKCHIPLALHGEECVQEAVLQMGTGLQLRRVVIPVNRNVEFRPQGDLDDEEDVPLEEIYIPRRFTFGPEAPASNLYIMSSVLFWFAPITALAVVGITYNRESIILGLQRKTFPYVNGIVKTWVEHSVANFVTTSPFFGNRSASTRQKVGEALVECAEVPEMLSCVYEEMWDQLAAKVDRLAKVATVGLAVLLAYRLVRSRPEPQTVVESEKVPSLVNKGIRSIYAQPQPGDYARNWSAGADPMAMMTDVSATTNFDDIIGAVKRNTVWLSKKNEDGKSSVLALRLTGNFFLSVKHYFLTGGVYVYRSGDGDRSHSFGEVELRVEKEVWFHPTKDISVFHLVGMHPGCDGVYKHLVHGSQLSLGRQFDRSVVIFGGSHMQPPAVHEVQVFKYVLPQFTEAVQKIDLASREGWSYGVDSRLGWCGSPLLVKRQHHCWIAGMHVAGDRRLVSNVGLADEVTRFDVDPLIAALKRTNVTARESQPVTLSQGLPQAGFEFSSKLWDNNPFQGALKVNCEVVGSVEKALDANPRAAHYKTSVKPTPFAADFEDLCEKYLDGDHYVGPTFKGREIDGVWREPISDSLKACEGVVDMPRSLLDSAVDDYLSGVELLPGTDTFKVLTNEETLYGIPGTCIKGFDRTTSAGYPFFTNKTCLVSADPVVGLSERFLGQLDWAKTQLKNGFLANPFVSWTLKDEPHLSLKILMKNKARVFMCFPFFLNFLLKQYCGPIVAFILMHKQFFECYAGMNISSRDCSTFYQHMTQFGTHNSFDADAEKWDKRLNTTIRVAVIEILIYLSLVLGYSDEERQIVAGLLVSELYHYAYCRGGVLAFSFTDPSGSFLTIVHNSLGQSVMMRFFWNKYYAGYVFRDHVRLAHVGDDSLQCVADGFSAYCFVTVKCEGLQYGVVFTPGDKGDGEDYSYKEFNQCSFLKRRIVWNADLDSWVPLLDMKSIVKTLTVMMPGKTSQKDQLVGALGSVLRELFLYGRPVYEEYLGRITDVVHKHEIWDGFLQSYDSLKQSFGKDHFAVWASSDDMTPEAGW